MADGERIPDDLFLQELRGRLERSGNAIVIVDRRNFQFGKFLAYLFVLFLFVAVVFFGINIQEMADEMGEASQDLTGARSQMETQQSRIQGLMDDIARRRADLDRMVDFQQQELERQREELQRMVDSANAEFSSIQSIKEEMQAFTNASQRLSTTAVADFLLEAEVAVSGGNLRRFYLSNIALAEQAGLAVVQAELLRRLAQLDWDTDRPLAERNFRRAIEVAKSGGQLDLAADLHARFGDILTTLYHSDGLIATSRAMLEYSEALAIHEELDDKRGQAVVLDQIGNARKMGGDFEGAVEAFEAARGLYREIDGFQEEERVVIESLAGVYRDLGEPAKARRLWTEAVSIAVTASQGTAALEGLLELARLSEGARERDYFLCSALRYVDRSDDGTQLDRFRRRAARISDEFGDGGTCS